MKPKKSSITKDPHNERDRESEQLEIIYVDIKSVIPWKHNPRGAKEKDFERLKKQIKKLGIYKPLVCYKEAEKYVVLGGNMRIRALKEMGYKRVGISIVYPKNEAEKIEYALSDNDRIGYYEEQALAELIVPHIAELDIEAFRVDLTEPWIDLKRIAQMAGVGGDEAAGEWAGMPEYLNKKESAYLVITVHFQDQEAVDKFVKMVKQPVTQKTKYLWFPPMPKKSQLDKGYQGES